MLGAMHEAVRDEARMDAIMIDIANDSLILIRDVPRLLPPRPNGKRVHISACYRWLSRGVKGVVLESVKIGGSTYTSQEALQRFVEEVSSACDHRGVQPHTPARRQKEIDDASRRLANALKPGRGSKRNKANGAGDTGR